MKILFISRKFPPQVGGMEQHNFHLFNHLRPEVTLVPLILHRKQLHLLWWLPYAFVQGLRLARGVDLIYLGDGLLAPLGLLLSLITRKRVVATLHGLDVTYDNWFYQQLNVRCVRRLDGYVAVSQAMAEIFQERGFAAQKMTVIPNGVDARNLQTASAKGADFVERLALKSEQVVLVTTGRLVKRKGVAWFIDQVLTQLPRQYLYCVVGGGPEQGAIERLIRMRHLSERVRLLGRITDDELGALYRRADLFLMPNVYVPGDPEGFGIAAAEAMVCGLPVLASHLEGITEVIYPEVNGWFAPPKNGTIWKEMVQKYATVKRSSPEFISQMRKFTGERFSWQLIAQQYANFFQQVVAR